MISAHAPTAEEYDAQTHFVEASSKYNVHPYRVLLFIDAYSRPEETVSTARSGNSTYLREVAYQFSNFLY